jgi:TP901 family phage tail tape measure protein
VSILITQLVARVVADTVEFNAGMAQVQAKTAAVAGASNKAGASQVSAARRMSTLSKVALGGAVIGVVKSIQSFADYDRQMNITQRITGATEQQMKKMRDTSIKLGADSALPGVTASDVAKGMQELGRAGFGAQDVLDSIHGTMLLGTAAQIDYADAAKITAQAINTFSLSHKQAGHVADLFSAAANASQGEVVDVADAFRYSASQAQQAGVGINDLTLLIAKLSNNGVEASVAGTALRAMFTRLSPHTAKQAEAWKQLNLLTKDGKSVFFDAQGRFVGIRKAADLYANSMKGLTAAQRVNLNYQAFGVAGTRGFFNAFNKGSKGLDALHKKFRTHGAAARVAAANTKGVYGAMQALENVVQTLGLLFGEALAPYVIAVSKALSAMLIPLTRHKTVMTIVAGALALLVAGLLATKIALIVWSIVTGEAAVAMWGLTTAILANPIGLIAVAIIGLILILRHFGVSMDDFKRGLQIIWDWITRSAGNVIDWFKKNWLSLVTWILFPLPRILIAIVQHWDKVKAIFKKGATAAWAWVVKKFWEIVHFIEGIAPQAYEAARNLGSEIARGVLDGLGNIAEQISEKINPFHRPFKWLGGEVAGVTGAGDYKPHALTRQHSTLHPGVRPSGPGTRTTTDPTRKGASYNPAMHVEHMHVRNEADARTLGTVLGRKVVTER